MNKTEFLNALEAGLGAASPEERVAAMQYYTEYFDEAGPEQEVDVLAELGEPQKLAEEIIAASGAVAAQAQTEAQAQSEAPQAEPSGQEAAPGDGQPQPSPEGEAGAPQPQWQQAAPPPPPHPPVTGGYTPVHYRYATQGGGYQAPPPYTPQPAASKPGVTAGKVLFIVLACIFIVPLLGGLTGVLAGILAVLVVVFLIPMILAVAFVASGIGCIIMGGLITAGAVGSGIFTIGVGICLLGLGLLCGYGGVMLLGRGLPKLLSGLFGGIASLWRRFSDWFKKL